MNRSLIARGSSGVDLSGGSIGRAGSAAGCGKAGSGVDVARARVIGNRQTVWLSAKRTLLGFGEAGGVGGALARRAAASTGVVAGMSGGVRSGSKFSFFITTRLWCCRRSSPSLGRSSDLLVSASGFAPSLPGRYVIRKLKRDRNSD